MEINVVGSKIERAKIKVVGVGGGGGNAVIHMINHDIKGDIDYNGTQNGVDEPCSCVKSRL